tara:strand:+ start:21 stop:1253 length:1233 start_codon:yes stop_codon:yes gene_type:complete
MGSIFKKIKKTVTKIKNPLGKLFKKVGKGIANVGGKIWKGVKDLGMKAYNAYGKISQKLGPIGMIGVSMAMPYLLGAFGTTAGGLWTNFGSIATKGQLSTNPFLKVFGYAGKGVYNTANFIGGTSRGISQTISKTFGSFAEGNVSKGFSNFFRGTSEVLTGKSGMGTISGLNKGGYYVGKNFVPYVTQTGGVGLGNVNVMNKLYHESVNATMKNLNIYKNMSDDVLKYHRSVVNKAGLDAKTGLEYITKNGVSKTSEGKYILDRSLSSDFKWSAPPSESIGLGASNSANYSWSGDGITKSFKAFDINANVGANAGYQWKPDMKGDVFETNASILAKTSSSKAKDILGAMKNHIFGDAQEEPVTVAGSANELAQVNTGYDKTQMTKAAGSLTTDEYKRWLEQLNMDITGSR